MPDYLIERPALKFSAAGELADLMTEGADLGREFSIELGFRPDVVTGKQTLLGVNMSGLVTVSFGPGQMGASSFISVSDIAIEDRKLSVFGNTVPNILLIAGTWYRVLLAHNGKKTQVSLQQAESPAQTWDVTPMSEASYSLGSLWLGDRILLGPGPSKYQGLYAELSFWKVARGLSDRKQPLNGDEPGLLGYWPLDEGIGDRLFDISINRRDGQSSGHTWEPFSRLSLPIGDVGGRLKVMDRNIAEVKEAIAKSEADKKRLTDEVSGLDTSQKSIAAANDKASRDNAEALQKQQLDFKGLQADIEKKKADQLRRLGASQQITLGNFIERLEEKLAKSRRQVVGDQGRRLQGLETVRMDVKMVPGYGGQGLQLPQPGVRTEPGRLSTLSLRLAIRPNSVKAPPKLAPVPEVLGGTEIYARRVLGQVGFRVDIMVEAASTLEQHGRVMRVFFKEIEPGKAEFDSVITLVVGQHAL